MLPPVGASSVRQDDSDGYQTAPSRQSVSHGKVALAPHQHKGCVGPVYPGKVLGLNHQRLADRRRVLAHELAQVHQQPEAAALIGDLRVAAEPPIEVKGQVIGAALAEGSGDVQNLAVDDGGFAAEPAAELRPQGWGELAPVGSGEVDGVERYRCLGHDGYIPLVIAGASSAGFHTLGSGGVCLSVLALCHFEEGGENPKTLAISSFGNRPSSWFTAKGL